MATDDEGIVGDELLSKTGGGGLFSDGYLAEKPIESYLDADEQPRVVFATDGSGVVCDRPDGQTTYEPASNYRTLVAATSHRVVLVVGGADDGSDHFREITLTRIDHVEAASGFRESTVRLWVGDDVWELSVATTDPEAVETYLSTASQRRIRFERLLGEAEDAIVAAADACSAGRLQVAEAALERADSVLAEARDSLDSFPADVPEMDDRFDAYRERYRTEAQRLFLKRAEQARANARDQWRAGDYEAAADAYQQAREVCETVLERRQLSPKAARRIRDVLTSIERDRGRLAVAPIRTAAAFERAAAASALPGEAAARWESAYDRYRQVLELDWGADDDRFVGDADRVRERLAAIAAELLAARSRAAEQHRRAAIRLTTVESPVAAMDASVDARDHLQTAIETARELDPAAVPSLREQLKAVERRVEVLAEGNAETGRQTVRTSGGLPVGDAGPIRPVLEAVHSELVQVRTDERLPAVRGASTDETSLAVFEIVGDQHPALAVPHDSRAQYLRRVESLGEQSLRHTVADVWRDLGWAVERTEGGSALLARRPDVGVTLLLSVRRRASPVGPSVVTALAGRAAGRDDDPWPILVTTDPIEPDTFETAISAGVTLVDARGLAELCYRTDD